MQHILVYHIGSCFSIVKLPSNHEFIADIAQKAFFVASYHFRRGRVVIDLQDEIMIS